MLVNPDLAAHVRRLLVQYLPDGVVLIDVTEKKMFGSLALCLRWMGEAP